MSRQLSERGKDFTHSSKHTLDDQGERQKETQTHTHTYLGDSGHQPHSLLWVRQEDFGHDGHEDGEDLVTGVTHPGDELGEGGQELIRCQVGTVFAHGCVYFPQLLSHLSVYSPGCGVKICRLDLNGFTYFSVFTVNVSYCKELKTKLLVR